MNWACVFVSWEQGVTMWNQSAGSVGSIAYYNICKQIHFYKYRATECCMTLPPLIVADLCTNYNYGRGVSWNFCQLYNFWSIHVQRFSLALLERGVVKTASDVKLVLC